MFAADNCILGMLLGLMCVSFEFLRVF